MGEQNPNASFLEANSEEEGKPNMNIGSVIISLGHPRTQGLIVRKYVTHKGLILGVIEAPHAKKGSGELVTATYKEISPSKLPNQDVTPTFFLPDLVNLRRLIQRSKIPELPSDSDHPESEFSEILTWIDNVRPSGVCLQNEIEASEKQPWIPISSDTDGEGVTDNRTRGTSDKLTQSHSIWDGIFRLPQSPTYPNVARHNPTPGFPNLSASSSSRIYDPPHYITLTTERGVMSNDNEARPPYQRQDRVDQGFNLREQIREGDTRDEHKKDKEELEILRKRMDDMWRLLRAQQRRRGTDSDREDDEEDPEEMVSGSRYSKVLVPCPFSDNRSTMPPLHRAKATFRTRRLYRLALTEFYGYNKSMLHLAHSLINQHGGGPNRTWGLEEFMLIHFASALDGLLLDANEGSWTLWSEHAVDLLIRGFLEMSVRVNPDRELPQFADPHLGKKLKGLQIGQDKSYGPIRPKAGRNQFGASRNTIPNNWKRQNGNTNNRDEASQALNSGPRNFRNQSNNLPPGRPPAA